MSATRVFRMDPDRPDLEAVRLCAGILAGGGLVAFPTETVYGLGGHALRSDAARRIYAAKRRPADNPLIVHTQTAEDAFALARSIPTVARKAARAFWPGPLTIVLEKEDRIPPETTAGLSTVALRVPAHPIAQALLKVLGAPIAAPSANASGRPSPTRAEHVLADLNGRIDAVIDAGETGVGLESTVIDLTVDPPEVLRLGGAALEDVGKAIGRFRVSIDVSDASGAPRAPGQKYRHYAPRVPVTVVTGSPRQIAAAMRPRLGRRDAGWLISRETAQAAGTLGAEFDRAFVLGSRDALDEVARRLYHGLRAVDGAGVDAIYVEAMPEQGLGRALMDRMMRASEGNVVDAAQLVETDR